MIIDNPNNEETVPFGSIVCGVCFYDKSLDMYMIVIDPADHVEYTDNSGFAVSLVSGTLLCVPNNRQVLPLPSARIAL